MTAGRDQESKATCSARHASDMLLSLGAAMLRAGSTASRTREWIELLAAKLGFEASVSLSFDSIAVSVRRPGEATTAVREVGPPAVNAARIGALEHLAGAVGPGLTAHGLAADLAHIESGRPQYSGPQITAAIAIASAAFAFLNGGSAVEMTAAAIGGGAGQALRAWFARRHVNQFGVAAACAIAASGVYLVTATLAAHLGLAVARLPAGFIASVLFLVPGFPLVAGLFDLLHNQTTAAVGRLAYGVMLLLAVAFGLSVVVAVAGIELARQPPLVLAYPVTLLWRAVASFLAASAFAILFNSVRWTVLAAGAVAIAANGLRLVLQDMGMMLAPATFFGALAVGLIALLVHRWLDVPRIAIVVPAIVIMVPGFYAFEMIVLFNRGQVLEAVQASAACGFAVGALAMGLAAARLVGPGWKRNGVC